MEEKIVHLRESMKDLSPAVQQDLERQIVLWALVDFADAAEEVYLERTGVNYPEYYAKLLGRARTLISPGVQEAMVDVHHAGIDELRDRLAVLRGE